MTAAPQQARRGRALRLVTRLTCLGAAVLLLWPLLPQAGGPKMVASASPFVAICSGIAARTVGLGALVGLAAGAISLLRRRWFCRYACPVGLLLEGACRVGLRRSSWWTRCPPFGQYVALLTVAGAVVGYPVLLLLDPLSMLSSAFGLGGADGLLTGVLAGAGVGILVLSTLLFGTPWCSRFCPLGGTQELLASVGSLAARRRKDEPGTSPSQPPPAGGTVLARRALLAGAAGVGLGLWARKAGATRSGSGPLRPPGAVEEDRFTGLCVRCGNCVRTCPSRIVHPDLGEAGLTGLLAPLVRFNEEYCREDCNACTQGCPSGALRGLDLQHKRLHVIGRARLDRSVCILVQGEGECAACLHCCPVDAIRTAFDKKEYVSYPAIDLGRCNGCGACQVVCPTQPVKAMRVEGIGR